jgi:protein SCO1/2
MRNIVLVLVLVLVLDPRAHADTPRLDDRIGTPLPLDLPFTSSTGERVTLRDYLAPGRPIVLVLAYARCRMLCNVVLRGVADAIRTSPPRDYTPVIVSLDPRETPADAGERQGGLLVAAHLHSPREWPYLTGASVTPLAEALGFHYAWDPHTEQYAHPAVVFVIAPDGRLAGDLRGVVFDGLPPLVARAARGELAGPDATDVLRCFHFDPALRRYESRLQTFFRLGALTVLAALLAIVTVVVRARRRP